MIADLLNDSRFWDGLIAAGVVLAVLAVPLFVLMRRDPFRALMTARDPVERSVPGWGLAAWESGVDGPHEGPPGLEADIARHLVAAEPGRCAIRTGGRRHRWRLFLAIGAALPAIGLGLVASFDRIVAFLGRGGGRCLRYVEEGGEVSVVRDPLPATPVGYLMDLWCSFTLRLHPAYEIEGGGSRLLHALGRQEIWSLLVLIAGIALLLILRLRKDPAPLVVDRGAGVVWTTRRGRILAARWHGARITAAKGAGRTATLAIALHPLGADGRWGEATRWVALSGWSGSKPWRWERADSAWQEWDRQRRWISAWLAGEEPDPEARGTLPRTDAPLKDLPPGPYAG
ncbi:MAG: hypothetical protein AAFQ51_02010 [Pseudomonadota bacterium]